MRLLSLIPQRLLAACCGALLLAACAHGVVTQRPTDVADSSPLRGAHGPGTYAFVEAIRDYARPHDVPVPFHHLVDWHGGTDPVVLLLSAGGDLACAITPLEAMQVVLRHPYRCRWRPAR